MKHTRKIMSPICVTRGFVELGVIMGTPASWQTGPPARLSLLATSPSTAATLSLLTRRSTASFASPASPRVSYSFSSINRPFSPPLALNSLIASLIPLLVDCPNVASEPVIDP